MASVYLSPSVQDWNLGYGNYGTEEQRMNEIADVVERILRENGVTVYRNSPSMTLREVVADSNTKSPDLHVAIHSNASVGGNARGAEVYAHRFGGLGERLANNIYDEISKLTPTSDLGVKEGYKTFNGQGMYELRRTVAPAALAEVAFHDNPDDAQFIMDNIEPIGRAIAEGILETL